MSRMTPAEIVAWLREQAAGAPTDLACERLGAAADLIERQAGALRAVSITAAAMTDRAYYQIPASILARVEGALSEEEESRG